MVKTKTPFVFRKMGVYSYNCAQSRWWPSMTRNEFMEMHKKCSKMIQELNTPVNLLITLEWLLKKVELYNTMALKSIADFQNTTQGKDVEVQTTLHDSSFSIQQLQLGSVHKHSNVWSNKGHSLVRCFQRLKQFWINSAKTLCLSHCACKWGLHFALWSPEWIKNPSRYQSWSCFIHESLIAWELQTGVPSLWFVAALEWSAEVRQVSEDLFHWYSTLATCWSKFKTCHYAHFQRSAHKSNSCVITENTHEQRAIAVKKNTHLTQNS